MRKLACLLLVAFIALSITTSGCDLFGDDEESSPSTKSSSGDWYALYFVPGEDVESHLIDFMNSATQRLYAAVHEISVESITTSLIAAHERGVEVKVVMEKDYSEPEEHATSAAQYSRLEALGLVRTDLTGALMHNKFVVADSKAVWTGSTNLTDRGVNHNNNNVIVIESAELSNNYETEFEEMWNGKFGAKSKPSNTPYPQITVDGTTIECYFAPEDSVEDEIIEELQAAESSIYFAAFTFTSDPIEDALLSKWSSGIQIKGIYETRQNSQYASYEPLQDAGVPVVLDGTGYTMHHKFFIIDKETVITGSYNPTKSANTRNDENVLIIHNSDIAATYFDEFTRMWNEWSL